jgi:predicted short-subunit dehydrogenase-like oxidoreductase (DUF2520 family)
MDQKTVAIIGAGRVGSSMGYLLRRAGFRIASVVTRSRESSESAAAFIGSGEATTDASQAAANAGIILITTPDRVIREICESIAASGIRQGSIVVHTSGAHSLDLLSSASARGAYRAVLHPLQSLATREEGIKTLAGSYFRIEADAAALAMVREIMKALGGVELVMPKWTSDKDSSALYHAGAVVVSNYFVSLVDYGLKFYQALGADKKEALKAVLPLIRGTLHNIESLGIPDALTGPIMRGDIETVRSHLSAMGNRTPELACLYKELARHTIAVAREKGSITETTASLLIEAVEE